MATNRNRCPKKSPKLLKLYEEQQQRMQGEGEDLMNVQEVIVLIDEEEDAENLRRLRAAACEKFAKEQLEKKLEKQRRYQQERMKRQKGRKINPSDDDDDEEEDKDQEEKKPPEEIQHEDDDLEEELKAKRYAEKQMGKLEDGHPFTGEVEQKISAIENFTGGTTSTNLGNLDTSTECTPYEWNKYNSALRPRQPAAENRPRV